MLNLGICYSNNGKIKTAIKEFEKCLAIGDGEAAYEIAKIYLYKLEDNRLAHKYFLIADKFDNILEVTREEISKLIKGMENV